VIAGRRAAWCRTTTVNKGHYTPRRSIKLNGADESKLVMVLVKITVQHLTARRHVRTKAATNLSRSVGAARRWYLYHDLCNKNDESNGHALTGRHQVTRPN